MTVARFMKNREKVNGHLISSKMTNRCSSSVKSFPMKAILEATIEATKSNERIATISPTLAARLAPLTCPVPKDNPILMPVAAEIDPENIRLSQNIL